MKKILTIISLLFFIISCNNQNSKDKVINQSWTWTTEENISENTNIISDEIFLNSNENKQNKADALKCIEKYKKYFGKKGGITVTGGEPLVQSEFVLELFKLCKEDGISTALDTSGYIFNEKVKEVLEYTDLVLLDIKCIDEKIYKELTGVELSNTLHFANYLKEIKKPTWIRHVVVPTITDDDALIKKTASFISTLDNVELVEILPYHTLGTFKYKELGLKYPLEGVEELSLERKKEIIDIFKSYGLSVH